MVMEQACVAALRERKFLLSSFPRGIEGQSREVRIVEAHFHDVKCLPYDLLSLLQEALEEEDYAEMMRSGLVRIRYELDGFKPHCSVRIGPFSNMRKRLFPVRHASDFFREARLQVSKRRHICDGVRIDVFGSNEDDFMIVAESDQPTSRQEVEVPEWLVPCLLREVTGEQDFYHDHIVVHGLPMR